MWVKAERAQNTKSSARSKLLTGMPKPDVPLVVESLRLTLTNDKFEDLVGVVATADDFNTLSGNA